MTTKQQTNSTNSLAYDPGSKKNYNTLTNAGTGVLSGYMNNPFNNGYFNLGQGMGQAAAQKQGSTLMNALKQNMLTSGISGNAGNAFQLGQKAKIGRATSSMGAQSTMANIQGALGRQMQATQMGMSFNPLLTGSSGQTVQQQSGLGTWLPQLAGAAIGAGVGAATGGMSTLGGVSGSSMFSPASSVFGGLSPSLMSSMNNNGFNVGPSGPMNPFTSFLQ